MTSIENADEQQLLEMKNWFFKENIRIQQEKDMLLEDRRRLEQEKARLEQEKARFALMRHRLDNDKELFDKKTEVLILELRRLASDREKLASDRERLAREKAEFLARKNKEVRKQEMEAMPKMFFVGVNNELALKKRYRDLLKIFHPDNACGNTDAVLYINKEYNALKNLYC